MNPTVTARRNAFWDLELEVDFYLSERPVRYMAKNNTSHNASVTTEELHAH